MMNNRQKAAVFTGAALLLWWWLQPDEQVTATTDYLGIAPTARLGLPLPGLPFFQAAGGVFRKSDLYGFHDPQDFFANGGATDWSNVETVTMPWYQIGDGVYRTADQQPYHSPAEFLADGGDWRQVQRLTPA